MKAKDYRPKYRKRTTKKEKRLALQIRSMRPVDLYSRGFLFSVRDDFGNSVFQVPLKSLREYFYSHRRKKKRKTIRRKKLDDKKEEKCKERRKTFFATKTESYKLLRLF